MGVARANELYAPHLVLILSLPCRVVVFIDCVTTTIFSFY